MTVQHYFVIFTDPLQNALRSVFQQQFCCILVI